MYKLSWVRAASTDKQCSYIYEDTQKPLNEFKIRLRSTLHGPILALTRKRIHSNIVGTARVILFFIRFGSTTLYTYVHM